MAVYGDVRTSEEVATDMNAVNVSDNYLYGYWDLSGVQTPAPVKDLSANGADLEYIQLDTWYEADYDMTDGDYTMIVLPDTQRITKNAPEDATAMMEWIAANADALNCKFVMHMGDFTDGGNQLSEFGIASNYMSILDEAGIPWSMIPGNHDYDDELASTDNLVNFNDAFPYSKYSRNEWFGGFFPRILHERRHQVSYLRAGICSARCRDELGRARHCRQSGLSRDRYDALLSGQ